MGGCCDIVNSSNVIVPSGLNQMKNNAKVLKFQSAPQEVIYYPEDDQQDRVRYEGQIKNGKYEGKGKLFFNNGQWYEGKFKAGKFHGLGTFYYSNGNCYEGRFRRGFQHGTGIQYYADGGYQICEWDKGLKQGIADFYYQLDQNEKAEKRQYKHGERVYREF